MNEAPQQMDVNLDVFEGPLDLLLHLIKKNDLEISDIPIAQITQEYLSYLDLMKDLNLEMAGEFLVMASTLVQIKAQMLLPAPDPTERKPAPTRARSWSISSSSTSASRKRPASFPSIRTRRRTFITGPRRRSSGRTISRCAPPFSIF